ncbi:MAG: hypothetical protein QMB53_04615 [Eubacteriales bacterium]
MKIKRKLVALALTILMIGLVSAHADTVQPMYTYIDRIICSLTITSGTAYCGANITPSSSSYSSFLSATLKRSIDGKTWSSVKTWSTTGIGLTGATIDELIAVSSGYQYKLFATGTIKDANGVVIETASKNSPIITY